MNEITNICNSCKLIFAHNIQILPGLKTARISGTATKEHSDLSLKKPLSYTQRIVQDPNVVEQHKKELAILQAEIINSQQELNKAKPKLEKLQKSDQEAVLGAKIKQLKDRFKSLLTRDEREKIIDCRNLISSLKQDLYRKRMAVRFDKAIQEQVKRNYLIDGANDLTFSSTDNGLVNLSTSVPFAYQQFQFHIQLYKRYHVLQEPNVDIKDEETAFLNLPQSKTINANEIDINCMHRKNRKHLEWLKKKASQGEEVSTLEAKFEKVSFSASNNVEEFQQNYRVHEDCSKKLRSFYSSSNRANRLRNLEIQKKSTWKR
ncbi:hypothetical protein RMCBS344292_05120 [Rhizopus microsporus]|nr:hypothetical protein RMCBS344292_05120 [Rhizopus microsporus]